MSEILNNQSNPTSGTSIPRPASNGMKIAIIGTGYVGLTTGTCLADLGHDVIAVDIDEAKVQMLKEGKSPIFEPGLDELIQKNLQNQKIIFTTDLAQAVKESEVIFVCVNTPARQDGRADLRYVEKVARDIAQHMNGYKVIVDKSTVPLRTAEKVKDTIKKYSPQETEFDVISNPEFLREGSAIHDTFYPDRIVIGVDSKRAEDKMREVFAPLVAKSNAPIKIVSVRSAELIKHGANTFLATKISFANMISEVCENANANAAEVLEAIGLDERIGKHFLNHGIGYGGSCFPKDVSAFKKTLETLGVENTLISAVEKINDRAWKNFLHKIERELWVLDGKEIAVLGLAFKPNTDDIRNAPALNIIKALLEDNAKIKAYDPEAMDNVKKVFPDIYYANDPYEAVQNADALVICTEWDEFKNLDLDRIKQGMRTPTIFDGRNVLDDRITESKGFTYYGVGR